MRRFNSGPRLQFLLSLGQRVTRFEGPTVSESVSNSVRGRFTRSEFADTPLKLACCSLTRVCLDALRFWRTTMKPPFTLFRRGKMFYCQETATGHQLSLKTRDEAAAHALLHAKNEAYRQPILNLQMARTYLTASDPEIAGRTWQASMDEMAKTKTGVTLHRHRSAMKDKAFDLIRDHPILETQASQLLKVLHSGSISTNIFLRRLHNFSLDMGWLPWPILAKKRWPKIHFKEKRAVTTAEHDAIVTGETNPERRAYYECCWHLGAAQTDVANLDAEDVDWSVRAVSFNRQKTGVVSIVRFGGDLEAILRRLPQSGPLFPNHCLKIENPPLTGNFREPANAPEFRVSRCIATATPGPSGRGRRVTPNGSPKRRWGMPARPCTALTQRRPRSSFRRWRTMRSGRLPPTTPWSSRCPSPSLRWALTG